MQRQQLSAISRATLRASALAILALSCACHRQADSPVGGAMDEAPRNPGGSGSAQVTYRPQVHVIERTDGLNALISVSSDGSTLVFNRTLGKIPTMADGEVVLIKGLMARKIIASESKGDELAVLTVPVGLLDIVTDAKVHVEAPIRFGRSQSVVAETTRAPLEGLFSLLATPAYAQSPTAERHKQAEKDAYGNLASSAYHAVVDGWETDFRAEPAPGRVNLFIELKKSLANATAVITGEGYLADFDFSSDIDVEHSVTERVQMNYKKLNGNMNFKWAVQTTAAGALRGNAKMKLPAAIQIPLYQYLGGLPLFLEISGAVLVKPAFGAQYEFATGAFRITYDGYQSFLAKEGNVDADGKVTGDIKFEDSEAGSGAPVGLVLGFAAPRIELSIGVSKILKFDGVKEAAAKADEYFDLLVARTFGADALHKFKSSPMSEVTAGKIADAALGSDAAAYIELTTTTGMSHTGAAVMVPCIRTDVHLSASVGASANAFGQSVGNAEKEIFKKDYTRVKPSEDLLCKNI